MEVNDRAVEATTQPVTGEITFPVNPGTNRVRVVFTRTLDRLMGGIISVATLLLLILLTICYRHHVRLFADRKLKPQFLSRSRAD